jgi:hypothetical protein
MCPSGRQPRKPDRTSHEEEHPTHVVDGTDAQGVGGHAAEHERGQPAGLPEQVEAGEHPPPRLGGDLGLEQRV